MLAGVGLALALGASSTGAAAVAGVVAVAAALGALPILSPKACDTRNLGLVTLGVTVVQTMLAIAGAFVLMSAFAPEKRPVVLGAVGGVFITTALQALATLTLINKPAHAASPKGPATIASAGLPSSTPTNP